MGQLRNTPTHRGSGAARSRERTTGAHLKLMCDLHGKATQVHVRHFPYIVAQRYMKLDKGHGEPPGPGSKMPGVSPR